MPPRILVEIAGNSDQLVKELKKAGGSMHGLGKAAGIAGAAITTGLVVGLKKSADAAMDAQRVQAGTVSQLKALGISYEAHAKQIDKSITATSKLAAIDDEELQGSFNDLVRTTGNVSSALKDTSLAADISRGKHISLASATALVTKAELGKAGALTKAGIEVDKGATKLELLNTLHRKFAGAAEGYGKTAAASQERVGIAVENLQEKFGAMLLPVITKVSNAMAKLAGFLEEHTTLAKALGIGVAALAGGLMAMSVATKIAALNWSLLNVAFLASPIGIVIVSLVALGVGLTVAWQKSETFRKIVTGTWEAVKTGAQTVLNFFKSNWPIIATLISGPFAPIVALATDAFGVRSALVGAFNALKTFTRDTVGDIARFFTALPGKIGGAIGGAMGDLKAAVSSLFSWRKIVGWIKDALGFGSPSPHFMAIGRDIVDSMARGVGAAAGVLKDAVIRLAKEFVMSPIGLFTGGPEAPAAGSAGPFPGGLIAVGRHLQQMGFQVGEHPAFGGVAPVHAPNSYHYRGRAIDVNWPGGGVVELGKLRGIYGSLNSLKHVELMIEDIGRSNQHLHLAMAQGGIVTRPTMALIGEAGPEAVIPLGRGGGVGAGGGDVHIHLHGNYVDNKQALIRDVRDGIVQAGRRNGGGQFAGQG